jgi:THAP domain
MLECHSNYDAWLRDNDSVSVYKIPSDSVRREKWLKIIPRKNWNITVSSVVCIRHFKEKFLERYEIGKDGQQIVYKTPRLKRYAVPTLFGDPLIEVDHSESEDSDEDERDLKSLNRSKGTPAKDAPTAPGAMNNAPQISIFAPVVPGIYVNFKQYLVDYV